MSNQLIDLGIEKYLKRQRLNDFKGWVIVFILILLTNAYIFNKQAEQYDIKLSKYKSDYSLMIMKKNSVFMDSLIRFAESNTIEKNIIK